MNFIYADGHIYFYSALKEHKIEAVRSSPNARRLRKTKLIFLPLFYPWKDTPA